MLSKGATILASVIALTAAKKIKIDPSNRVMRDEFGRHTIFHGVNAVYKVTPYIPEEQSFDSQNSFDDEDIANLKKWGFNFVRLGVMWEAVETAPGVFDDKYLQEINDLIEKLGKAGIYTLVDAHQDVMARVMCGEGMPNFYAKDILSHGAFCVDQITDNLLEPVLRLANICIPMKEYGYKTDKDGNPLITECQKISQFWQYYMSPESFTIFRSMYNNDHGL